MSAFGGEADIRIAQYFGIIALYGDLTLVVRRISNIPNANGERLLMAQRIVTEDVADVAAHLLEADKRKLAESQAQLQTDFEAREAKFNADLETLTPQKPVDPGNSEVGGSWLLARKCWAWLYRD